ncbi:MAG TPA: tetratricopeptide repeat protein [Vicinamibacteria bacterium]|nr:tetratricopeptide repeat protein [Vicinamibacteria bacterium]
MKPGDRTALSAAQIRAQAYAEEREGRIWRAIALLKEAVDRGPDDWTSVRKLADLLTRAGQPKAANEQYRRLAQNCELDQLHMQAIAVWKRILSNEPRSASAHLKIGELYALAGLRADARKHYASALAWYRDSGRDHEANQVAARLAGLGEASGPEGTSSAVPPLTPEQAAGQDEEPLVDESEFVADHLMQARLFRRYGLRVQARARLETLLARLPDHLEARRELRDLLHESGRQEEAREQDRLLPRPEEKGPEPALAPEPRPSPEPPPPVAGPMAGPAEDRIAEAIAAPPPPEEPRPAPTEGPPRADGEAPDEAVRQMGRDDYETRYNLGIAYREMGLLDEAIAELQLAAASPARLVDCASMLAECFAEQARPAYAVKWLEKGLAAPGLTAPRRRALRYQLAACHEASSETSRAIEIYEELQLEEAGYRDVADRIRRLTQPNDAPAAES